jgi:hypothetical protein
MIFLQEARIRKRSCNVVAGVPQGGQKPEDYACTEENIASSLGTLPRIG